MCVRLNLLSQDMQLTDLLRSKPSCFPPPAVRPAVRPDPPAGLLSCLQEQYINDKDFLLSCAESAGLPRDAAAAVLDNPAGKGEQLVQQELGKYAGISGVPHFVINGRCVL